MSIRTVIITGAGGYVGSVLAAALRRHDMNVIGLARTGVNRFQLGEPIRPDTLAGADAIVHCAWDFRAFGRRAIQRVNVEGSLNLFDAAKLAGVKRIVFISSMSAFAGCRSAYGQSKLAVEQAAARFGAIIVRPGLVWGAQARGMVGALRKACSIPLITPLPGRGRQLVYLTFEEDLGELIWTLLTEKDAPRRGPILAACEQGETFRGVLEALAAPRKKIYLPIPPAMIWAGLRALELIGLRPRLRSDSMVSLLNPDPNPDFSAARRTGIVFRPFTAR
jgi:nucleoside-diphosphate-sugar epimerase